MRRDIADGLSTQEGELINRKKAGDAWLDSIKDQQELMQRDEAAKVEDSEESEGDLSDQKSEQSEVAPDEIVK